MGSDDEAAGSDAVLESDDDGLEEEEGSDATYDLRPSIASVEEEQESETHEAIDVKIRHSFGDRQLRRTYDPCHPSTTPMPGY